MRVPMKRMTSGRWTVEDMGAIETIIDGKRIGPKRLFPFSLDGILIGFFSEDEVADFRDMLTKMLEEKEVKTHDIAAL